MESSQRPRRSVLRAGLLGGATLLAGCVGSGDRPNGQNGQTTPTPKAVFESISFEGQNLVVHLQDDHDVTQVNLIAPDGSAFAEQPVATGATTVRIQILDMRFGIAGYEHYTPGKHELVAISADKTESMPLPLEPDLQVVDIRQYRDGDSALDLGRLVVEIENVGSGPTWVYDITYREAPNWTANDELSDMPGVIQLGEPESANELVILPSKSRIFVDGGTPILFDVDAGQSCSSNFDFTVVIGRVDTEPLEKRISTTLNGEAETAEITGDYTCSKVEVELVDNGDLNG